MRFCGLLGCPATGWKQVGAEATVIGCRRLGQAADRNKRAGTGGDVDWTCGSDQPQKKNAATQNCAWAQKFDILEVKYGYFWRWPLFSPHTYLRVGKYHGLRNKICGTLGNALSHLFLPILFELLLYHWYMIYIRHHRRHPCVVKVPDLDRICGIWANSPLKRHNSL
jgi:hypothetical protein